MSRESIRRIRIAALRARLADDAAAKPALTAIDQHESLTAELAAKRAELRETGHFSPAGIEAQLKPIKDKHAAAMQKAHEGLRTTAEKLLAKSRKEIALPGDHQRILDSFLRMTLPDRNLALAKAMSGRDEDLAATLAHESNARYCGLLPSTLNTLRTSLSGTPDEQDVPRLESLQLAAELLSDSINDLSQEA